MYKLYDQESLKIAESTLEIWAYTLAEAGRDRQAAEALRLAGSILNFRLEFLDSEKS